MLLASLFIAAYLVGSIPFGYLVAKAKGIDILHFGSGNIGATNVHRALGKWLGLLVFVLDVLKGLVPAAVAFWITKNQVYAFVVGMGAVTGHCLSPFLKFKGGKGISTGLGALLGSCPLVALCAFAIFFLSMLLNRYVSLSSLVAATALVPLGFLFGYPAFLLWALGLLAVFVFYRHRANIKRLLNGTEPKFTMTRSTPPAESVAQPASLQLK